jgi:hypothetical protein
MQNQINADSWEEFLPWVKGLQEERARLAKENPGYISEFVFRGHGSADWKLDTTLERYPGAKLRADEFYQSIYEAKYEIEALLDRVWTIPESSHYSGWLNAQTAFGLSEMPAYDYLVYLRHHGFPSPLLDWSSSPYIAAHFAFSGASASTNRIAIYAFIDCPGYYRTTSSQRPSVRVRGPNVQGHRRHFLQKSQYSICTQRRDGHWFYASHEDAFLTDPGEQSLLWKITIPAAERVKALSYLDQFNLNAYSLFGSEESLMQTMAFRFLK